MNGLEGANCADLPGEVVDKYFDCNASKEPLRAMVALAICDNCTVTTDCRELALNQPALQARGVIGGVTASEIRRARQWRSYELGLSARQPSSRRPAWLAISSAAADVARAERTIEDRDFGL